MTNCAPGLTAGGSTAHFTICYDPSLPNGQTLSNDLLANCEQDLARLQSIWPGTPSAASFQVSIRVGAGASHVGSDITVNATASTDGLGLPGLLVAEVDEIFMSTQEAMLGKGFNPGYSHGEGLSRVLAAERYPGVAGRFAVARDWLDTARPDWISNTEQTDQDGVSYGCATLFLNYLRHQLGFSWQQIVAAADDTLALVAQNLGVHNAYADFVAVVARHYPAGVPAANLPVDPEGLPIDNLFPLSCLYARHNLTDDGTSHTSPLSLSPDIIVKNAAVANPQATYSTPASITSDAESDPTVIDTQDNYVYLRVWNLGADAGGVTATAYWSPPATLVTPNMWNLIGQAHYPDVPASRVVEISSPGITWPAATIPAPGHYCFVATVGNDQDPAPTPASFASFTDFTAYIEANNNITWRNFNVVATAGGHHLQWPIQLPFLIVGAWDETRVFELEVLADLPGASHVALQVPEWLGHGLAPHPASREPHEDLDAEPERRRVRVKLPPTGHHRLAPVELPASAQLETRLLIRLPAADRYRPHQIAVKQLHAGREVGRITWQLVP